MDGRRQNTGVLGALGMRDSTSFELERRLGGSGRSKKDVIEACEARGNSF